MRGKPAELLVLVTALSLCSLFLTYQLAIPTNEHRSSALMLFDRMQEIKQPSSITERLHQLLRTLEQSQWLDSSLKQIAIVQGSAHLISRDLPAISSALNKISFEVEYFTSHNISKMQKEWSLFMCQSISTLECKLNEMYALFRREQRVNHIPGLSSALGSKTSICEIQTRLAALSNQQEPCCFILPQQYEELLNAIDAPDFNTTWLLKSNKPGVRPEILTTSEIFRRARLKMMPGVTERVMQQAVVSQLRVLGRPLSINVFVLITSIAPLRAYVHSQGLVSFRHDKERAFKKIASKTWRLSQLWRHLTDIVGATNVRNARESLDAAILRLLLISERSILLSLADLHYNSFSSRYRAQQSFHLIRVEVLLDSSLQPTILEVDPLPALNESPDGLNATIIGVPLTVLKDTFRLTFASDIVHNDVTEALQATATENTGILGLNCLISHELCLTKEDLLYILATRREALSTGNFRRLYPTTTSSYSDLLQKLQRDIESSPVISTLLRHTLRHTTADMDKLLLNIEKFFASQEVQDEDYSYQTERKIKHSSFNLQSVRSRNELPTPLLVPPSAEKAANCSNDPANIAFLSELRIEPNVEISPSFSPLWGEYTAEVDHSVTLVRIVASAMGCPVTVGFNDQDKRDRASSYSYNLTIGLGKNRISIQVYANDGSPLNSYSVIVVRREAEGEGRFDSSLKHQVCSLRQKCEFRFSPDESCGLYSEYHGLSWKDVEKIHLKLPSCDSGDTYGRWVIPCGHCNNHTSCWWHLAKWQPYACKHTTLSQDEIRNCLDGKKVLFLGDSTIRGMMHYMLERLNGSLSASDKTHSLRVYAGLNSGRTVLSFAYYPQFWLRAPQRPVFAKTLYHLLLKSQPLRNTSDTIIVVGGVHWLATHHLHTLLRAVRREGLQGAQLAIKTLGSGFHIPADGVHFLSKREQEKLLLHSRGLAAFAHHYHMEVVDTFNMTAARYLDFLPGKCACHFHKIEETDGAYHVHGPVNAIYSDILISRICKARGSHVGGKT